MISGEVIKTDAMKGMIIKIGPGGDQAAEKALQMLIRLRVIMTGVKREDQVAADVMTTEEEDQAADLRKGAEMSIVPRMMR